MVTRKQSSGTVEQNKIEGFSKHTFVIAVTAFSYKQKSCLVKTFFVQHHKCQVIRSCASDIRSRMHLKVCYNQALGTRFLGSTSALLPSINTLSQLDATESTCHRGFQSWVFTPCGQCWQCAMDPRGRFRTAPSITLFKPRTLGPMATGGEKQPAFRTACAQRTVRPPSTAVCQ